MDFEEKMQSGLLALKEGGNYRELSESRGLNFVNNDYLGLSSHPALREAGRKALEEGGAVGSRGSRLLGGHSTRFADLEAQIADFFGSPAALFFSTGYLANLGAVQAFSELASGIVSDEANHASLIDASRLARVPRFVVPHNRWKALGQSEAEVGRPGSLVVSESLFSMDGDFVDLAALVSFVEQRDGFLLLDEAHACGIVGPCGRGLNEGWSDWRRMAVTVTFGKAFGVAGAAVLCSKNAKAWLVNRARSFIYTTAPSPVVASMVSASLALVRQEPWRQIELSERAKSTRERLRETGCLADTSTNLRGESSPIIPFFVGGKDRALRFCENMRKSGFELRAIRYPTVPEGTERVRISLNLSVSRDDTERMARKLVKEWAAFSS